MAGTALKVGLDILKKVSLRVRTFVPFAVGEIIELVDTGRVNPKGFPIYGMGAGREVDLETLCNWFVDDEHIILANAEDEKHACLPRDAKPTLMYSIIEEAGGDIPAKISVKKRFKAGAKKEWLDHSDYGAQRKKACEMHGIDTTLEDFPLLYLRKGEDSTVKDNWKPIERLSFSVA